MSQFEKDLAKAIKQHHHIEKLKMVMESISKQPRHLDPQYLDHPLKGKWKGARECHIENDWLLIYRILKKDNEICFERLGTHSELFNE